CGTQEIDTATRTIMTMIVAETLGLEMSQVTLEIGDSNFPFAPGSGGSTTAAAVSPAIRVTPGKARDALFERIAPALGTTPDQMTMGVGRIEVGGATPRSVGWREACKILGTEPVSVDVKWEAGLSAG